MLPQEIINLNINIFPFVKGGLVAFLMFYMILSIMVIKQIGMMNRTLKSSDNNLLFLLAYAHFGVVVFTLLAILIVL